MPFGDTAKKIKKLSQTAEKIYERLNQLIEQIQSMRDRVENTSDQIEAIDRELAEQRAIVEALAREQDIDVDAVVAEVDAASETTDDGSATSEDAPPEEIEVTDGDATSGN